MEGAGDWRLATLREFLNNFVNRKEERGKREGSKALSVGDVVAKPIYRDGRARTTRIILPYPGNYPFAKSQLSRPITFHETRLRKV